MALTRPKFTQLNTTISSITDPILVLNQGSSLANVDIGLLMNRNNGTSSNVALFWNESGNTFVAGFTANTGINNSNVATLSFANLKVGNLFGNIGGGNSQANVYITGSLLPSSNVTYDLGSTTRRFKTLWLSGSTIVLGKEQLSVDDNGVWTFTTGSNTISIGGSSSNFQNATVSNLTITNALTLQGNTYSISTQDLTVVDSVIELHTLANLAPLVSNDGRDIGLKFHYYKTNDEHAFLGLANDSGYLEWYDSGRETVGNVFTGNTYGTIKTGGLILANTTISNSTTTGVLRVSGGVGIAGALYIANTGDVSANIGAGRNNFNTLDANVARYQQFANANLSTQTSNFNTLNSNVGVLFLGNLSTNANLGSYQTYANSNASIQQTQINNLVSSANTNTAAYISSYTGNVSAGNIFATTYYGSFNLGTTSISLNRASGTQSLTGISIDGSAGSTVNASITSNTSAGTAYITFASTTGGTTPLNATTSLIFNPATGLLTPYALYVNGGANSTSISSGALQVSGGAGISGNVYAAKLYTTNGLFWAGNGVAFSSGGGGAGLTYTASNTAPISPIKGDQWYLISSDVLYEYINDGTSNYWVDIQSAVIAGNTTPVTTDTLSPFLLAGM